MAFVAPRYALGEGAPFLPGWLGGTLGVTPEAAAAAPDPTAAKAADDALLQKLGRPGWIIASHAPEMAKDGTPTGNTAITISGPDGQNDQVIVDKDGNIPAGGQPLKNPDKPVAAPAPHQTQAEIDQAAADAHDTSVRAGQPKPAVEPIASAETVRHNKATEDAAATLHQLTADNQARQNDLAAQRLEMEQATQAFDQSVREHGMVTQDAKDAYTQAHQQAQDAQAAADAAEVAVRDENTRQYQSGLLSNSEAATAESVRANTAREKQAESDAQQSAQRDAQASVDRQRDTGAKLLDDRATQSTSLLNNWVGQAGGNKNFGLGGPIDPGMAAGLMTDANTQATNAMGGQSVMDQATQMVHQANPALARTPQGAAYTAVAAQMLEKEAAAKAQPAPEPMRDTGTGSGQPEGTNRNAPMHPLDPAGIGTAVGAAIAHIGGFTAPFAQSDIHEGTTR